MIIFFGPAGAGKSVQGQILAARQSWRWMSAGQLLRDTHDIELLSEMQAGKLIAPRRVNDIMDAALKRAVGMTQIILDGFPRTLVQAEWLIESQPTHGRPIGLAVVLEVPRSELLQRLEVRGRVDDTPEAIDERLKAYRQEVYPILSYFTEQNINIAHIDGVGTVGQVHDRITEELVACKLV